MRHWTVDEARAHLPRARQLLEIVRASAPVVAMGRTNGHGSSSTDDVRAAVEELESEGIVVRDPRAGLIDYPARGADGVEYLLCYRLDEDDLAWWHLPEEGFAGRKPLHREPA